MANSMMEVDPLQLGREKDALLEEIRGIKDAVMKVYQQMNELDAMWDGAANTAFINAFVEDGNLFNQQIKLLLAYAEKLEFAKTEYIRCEDQVRDAINAIRV